MLTAYRAVDGGYPRLLLDFRGRPGNHGAVNHDHPGLIERDVASRGCHEIGRVGEADVKDLDAVERAILDIPPRSVVSPAQDLQQRLSDLSEADNQDGCRR